MNISKLSIVFKLLSQGLLFAVILSCSKDNSQFFYGVLDVQNPKIIIASNQAGSTALVMYDIHGNFLDVIADFASTNLTPRGLAGIDPLNFFVSIEGNDHIQRFNLLEGSTQTIADTNLTGNIFQMRRHARHGNFVIEGNTIESFTDAGERIGNPRIPNTAIPGCTALNVPRGLAFNAAGQLLVVDTGSDDLLIYDVSQPLNPTCVAANTTLGNVDPVAVLSHSNGFIYVATLADDRIYRFSSTGLGAATTIFNNTAIILNPQALLEMPDGSILVASEGTNTVVRILPDGSYVGSTPFIFDIFSNSISDMILLQENMQ